MRRRSNTIYADSVEDYIHKSQLESSYPYSYGAKPSKRPTKQSPLDTQTNDLTFSPPKNSFCSTNLDFAEPERFTLEEKTGNASACWSDFDFDIEDTVEHHFQKKGQEPLSLPSLANTADTDCTDDAEEISERSQRQPIVKKVMVIGLNGAGKHSLINTAFECEQNKLESEKKVMDLLMKTEKDEDDTSERRYQFWIRTIPCEGVTSEILENLVKLYYKNVSLFVFMYSIADRKSFECLTNAIQAVKDEVGEEKFTGVLLGSKCDLEMKREVSLFEGIALQEKYKLTFFMETNYSDASLKERLVEVLHDGEGVSELQSKKRFSILSD